MLGFVFPGQGSQSVGMLDAWGDTPVVQSLLQAASEALGQDLGALIARGPADELSLTVNTQPAMLVAGLAAYRAWREAGGPDALAMAGHSLGEYTALTAADVFDVGTAVPLVRERARAMQEAVPVGEGAMAAILGLSDAQVLECCRQAAEGEVCEPANFNAPAQVVIAGHRGAVERACTVAKSMGAKRAVPLAVSAPFHSSLLRPAGERLASVLAGVAIGRPRVPVINNIDVAAEDDPGRILDALVRQASGPVRWVEVVRALRDRGVEHLVEFGPGKVLAGLARRVDSDLKVSAVFDPDSLRTALEALA